MTKKATTTKTAPRVGLVVHYADGISKEYPTATGLGIQDGVLAIGDTSGTIAVFNSWLRVEWLTSTE